MTLTNRKRALEQALASNALSDRHPSDFGRFVHAQWANDMVTADNAVELLVQHYKDNPIPDDESDFAAQDNHLGLTDSRQLRLAEADITMIRLAEIGLDSGV
jgi:hypothetical protein